MLAYGSTAVAAAVAQRCAGCLSIVARKSCRTIASSAAASGVRQDNAPLVHLEQGSALKEVEQLDRRAQNLYREHPLAFHNFPVENLEWRATTNMLGVFSTLSIASVQNVPWTPVHVFTTFRAYLASL